MAPTAKILTIMPNSKERNSRHIRDIRHHSRLCPNPFAIATIVSFNSFGGMRRSGTYSRKPEAVDQI